MWGYIWGVRLVRVEDPYIQATQKDGPYIANTWVKRWPCTPLPTPCLGDYPWI